MSRVAAGLRQAYGHPGVRRLRRALRGSRKTSLALDRVLAARPAQALVQRLRGDPPEVVTGTGSFDVATIDDLLHCYRLLLRREPDPAGWEFWRSNIAKGRISLKALTTSFLACEEFLLLHPGGEGRQLVDLAGFSLFVGDGDDAIGGPLAATEVYEPHVVAALRDLLGPGSVFVDVGANIGFLSLTAAHLVGPTGRVVAIEPNPANCRLLLASARHNGFDQVEVHCKAAAEGPQTFVLEVDGSNGRVLALAPAVDPASVPASFVVEGVALDDLLAGVERVDVVKIDIEGAEPIALRGMVDTLRRHRPVVLTEYFPLAIRGTSETDPTAYLAALRELGYDLYVVEDDGGTGPTPAGDGQVAAALAASGSDHLDLLARPRPS